MGNKLVDVLDRTRRHAGLSHFELWFRYLELGGRDSPLELEAYLFGALEPTTQEHDLLVHVLNERFAELGRGHPVPYSDPRISLGDPLAAVRAALWDIDRAEPGWWDRVCGTCAEALSVSGAGIGLLGGDQRTSLGTSDPVAQTIEDAHFSLGEGPAVDAHRLGVAVHEPDLAVSGLTRWPMFAAHALEAGAAAIFAFPIRVGAIPIGTMDLYRDQPGPLPASRLAAAAAAASLVAHTVLVLQADSPTGTLSPALAGVTVRWVVHQATGMIAAQLDISLADALARLRSHAYAQDRPIDEIAAMVIARSLRLDDLAD